MGQHGRAQELCESRGGRPGLPSLIKPTVSVDVKQHSTKARVVSAAATGKADSNQGHQPFDQDQQPRELRRARRDRQIKMFDSRLCFVSFFNGCTFVHFRENQNLRHGKGLNMIIRENQNKMHEKGWHIFEKSRMQGIKKSWNKL